MDAMDADARAAADDAGATPAYEPPAIEALISARDPLVWISPTSLVSCVC